MLYARQTKKRYRPALMATVALNLYMQLVVRSTPSDESHVAVSHRYGRVNTTFLRS